MIGQPLARSASDNAFEALVHALSQRFTLGWTHYLALCTVRDPGARRFYEIEATANGWSTGELERQFASALIDVLHRAANLWAAGERQDLADFLATALPPGGADRMQRLAQRIVDVLPTGDKERGLYENFLVGARSLPAPTKRDEAAGKQQNLV